MSELDQNLAENYSEMLPIVLFYFSLRSLLKDLTERLSVPTITAPPSPQPGTRTYRGGPAAAPAPPAGPAFSQPGKVCASLFRL